jgi:D-glycero-D-manno-heptose 1,7-bisphosphate phosphatase
LNHDTHFPHRPEDLRWIDGAIEAIRLCNDAGWLVFVFTNQSGVARGYFDEAAVGRFHDAMRGDLAAHGAHIDDVRYCPHHPAGSVPGYARDCDCRKPAPGMLLDLMRAWPVDCGRSFVIGDRSRDLEAGAAAGLQGHLFRGGNLLDVVRPLIETASHPTP